MMSYYDLIFSINIRTAFKPVYNSHPWDQEKVVVVQKWSLLRGSTCPAQNFNEKFHQKQKNFDLKRT